MDPIDRSENGDAIYRLIEELYPICRSITGDGVRRSLQILSQHIPLSVHEIPSGREVFDWTIPDEWNIDDAWIKDQSGRRIVDFQECNLQVVNYSQPIHRRVSGEELKEHLHTLPDHPDWIPYRTTYYHRNWGFCVTRAQYDQLSSGEFEVCIDSRLEPGYLTYGELLIPGETDEEVVISAHICHPSLCNDNLTGVCISTFLAKHLLGKRLRYSYRFLYVPGTIGAITWLALNRETAQRIRTGLTLVCLGDQAPLTYKRTFDETAEIDRVAAYVLRASAGEHRIIDFSPDGYDERQFNSPGFRLPVGSLMRGRHGRFPEYHTSADNLEFVSPAKVGESFALIWRILNTLDENRHYRSRQPFCEVQLGKRGLYESRYADGTEMRPAMLWLMSMSDGTQSLLDICSRSGIEFLQIKETADVLVRHDLLELVDGHA